jgi:WD40-like Beta Propeller Repeat
VMSVSATVTALAEGAIRTMFLSKLKLTTAAMLAVALFAVFGVSALSSAAAKDRSQVRRNAPVPKAEKEGRILLWMDGKPLLLKADGTVLDSPPPIEKATLGVGWGHAKLSPDGKRVAFEKDGPPANKPRPKAAPPGVAFSRNRTTLQILDLDGKFEQNELDKVHVNGFHWLDGGKKLHVRGYEIGDGDVVSEKLEDWIYEPATDKLTSLKVPEHFVIRAISPDGKTTIVDEWKHSATEWHQHAHLWTIGSDKPTPLLELNQSFNNKHPMFSPDGKRALCQVSQYGKHTPNGNGAWTLDDFKFNNLLVVDLATKKTTVVKEYGEEADWRVAGFAWSPDGKRVAYTECQTLPQLPGKGRVYAFRVFTADPDGKNAKEIYLGQGSWLMGFDWK